MNLAHLKPGDKLAIRNRGNSWRCIPKVEHTMLTVTRTTATQVVTKDERGHYEVRFRIEDGKQVGTSYTYAVEVTPELLAEHTKQTEELARWRAAEKATDDLIGSPMHELKLTTDQLERLAAAWVEVKAMVPPESGPSWS